MKTIIPKQISNEDRKWFIVDAAGKPVGRLATEIATALRGKNKVDFAKHVDNGDYVIVTNADKVVLTGNKEEDKLYYRHSGYMGSLKATPAARLRKLKPTKILEFAVKGMLPKTKHQKEMLSRLKLFAGTEHTHASQQPQSL